MKITSQVFQSQIRPVRRKLEVWRQTRQHLAQPIPEPLWQAMAQLAQEHGVSRVCRALRVAYYDLQRRVRPHPPEKSPPATESFIELKVPALADASGCVVELQSRSGAKMTLRLASSAEVLNLVKAFWRRGR